MYTVCGHAHPHHTRPSTAVTMKTVTNTMINSSMSRTVSVGRNVYPKSVKRRAATSSRTRGFPFIRR